MTKYKAVVEYDGAKYHGWQWQPSLPTIQGALEHALAQICREPIRVHGAGRTDAGVHSLGQVAHFESTWSHSSDELQRACNALLPPDIVVRELKPVRADFHARHSAIAKLYTYRILNRSLRSCFWRGYAWHVKEPLDIHSMNEAARRIRGAHDFAAFGAPTDGTESTVRHITHAFWELHEDSGLIQFAIQGSGFLRYMVRSLVGTMVMVGRAKISPEHFLSILDSCDRSKSGPAAPPHGLYLTKVDYPDFFDEPIDLSACEQDIR
ncbi:MAG: tRNA pseudouridine(38-40) synthase TruA [Desulfomonilaceae bacterium]